MTTSAQACGCSKAPGPDLSRKFVTGIMQTPSGPVPQVSTQLTMADRLGAVRVRWGIGRDRYRIDPGLYAVGTPNERSDVLVTANYKLSFDAVRRHLSGMSVWLLVLDTQGINVWCAAGKGTFGTGELLRRIRLTLLEKTVIHRRLILPQLGATGVAAHRVKEASGFTVVYGPIRASDIPSFVQGNYRATDEMRLVKFGWHDRLVLTPNDFIYGFRYFAGAVVLFTILSGVNRTGLSFQQAVGRAGMTALNIGLGYLAGIVLTPLLLPYIPVRMFAFKGYVVGFVIAIALAMGSMLGGNILGILSWMLLIPSVSSFMAMNFTGSSTFTSLSGVKKEMKVAVPVQIASAAVAVILMLTSNLL